MGASGTETRLRAHVAALAGDIGERHLARPRALAAAADYVAGIWREQGYAAEREPVPSRGRGPRPTWSSPGRAAIVRTGSC
jgi:hypothetical protein